MHELSGARPGRISKQKSYRPVHSSARPDVFTLRRTVYSEGMGEKLSEVFEDFAVEFIQGLKTGQWNGEVLSP